MPNATLRLFFALWPDPPTRAALAALAQVVAGETGGRATAPANIHLTLAFLGAQPRDSVEGLAARARAIAASPFVLTLEHIDCWRKNGIAWIGASEIPETLALLRRSLVASLAAFGIADDPRPFAVHVTLARKLTTLPRRRATSPITWPVDGLALVASDPGPDGPLYRVLASLPFGPPR
ncbi:MAG TPA: RNA 2',3'-cyclic phosphodiesterase [Casimicrobiaceae bacterium]|jgi:2'-5' RNA ligase